MKDNRITVRFAPDVAEMINATAPNQNEADYVRSMVDALLELRKYGHAELRKLELTEQEITALTDSQNGVMAEPQWQCRPMALIAQLEDFEALESGISRHGTEPKVLMDKVKNISPAACYELTQSITEWWHNDANSGGFVLLYKKYIPNFRTSESQE